MTKKKTYNPFKMWGSWVGAILVGLILFFIFLNSNSIGISCAGLPSCSDPSLSLGQDCCSEMSMVETYNCFGGVQTTSCTLSSYITNPFGFGSFIIGMILGFLLGWGIHSLFRKYK